MITSFSESKNERISERILLILSNMINSSRELILNYWIYNEFECEIFEFIDIESIDIIFIDIVFRYKSLKFCVGDRDLSLSKRYVYYIFEIDYWDKSSDSCEYRDI